jgi:hypothetical protein
LPPREENWLAFNLDIALSDIALSEVYRASDNFRSVDLIGTSKFSCNSLINVVVLSQYFYI